MKGNYTVHSCYYLLPTARASALGASASARYILAVLRSEVAGHQSDFCRTRYGIVLRRQDFSLLCEPPSRRQLVCYAAAGSSTLLLLFMIAGQTAAFVQRFESKYTVRTHP